MPGDFKFFMIIPYLEVSLFLNFLGHLLLSQNAFTEKNPIAQVRRTQMKVIAKCLAILLNYKSQENFGLGFLDWGDGQLFTRPMIAIA